VLSEDGVVFLLDVAISAIERTRATRSSTPASATDYG
jgi:hypothetical protein